ncbi:uncharacterized protein LOC105167404 [Sesamum indicum]|uniref:Uncharacterized protein LOC105167404 n=1 Tax=Sesamum indicum TaxID=4182 RepID=A0A6I9TLY9_SESIN|nr:uncharacterized protein LOC105167404 [Sesamum indicum]
MELKANSSKSTPSTPHSESKPVVCKKDDVFSHSQTPVGKPTSSPFKYLGKEITKEKVQTSKLSNASQGDSSRLPQESSKDIERLVSPTPPVPPTPRGSKHPHPPSSSLGQNDGHPGSSPSAAPSPKFAGNSLLESPPHQYGSMGLSGVDLLWDEDDMALGCERIRFAVNEQDATQFDNLKFESLDQLLCSSASRIATLSKTLRQRFECLQQEVTQLQTAEKESSKEISRLKGELELIKKERDQWMELFKEEASTGRSFLGSQAGWNFLEEVKRENLEKFKKSVAFRRLVMDEATDIFDQTVWECRKKLKATIPSPSKDLTPDCQGSDLKEA